MANFNNAYDIFGLLRRYLKKAALRAGKGIKIEDEATISADLSEYEGANGAYGYDKARYTPPSTFGLQPHVYDSSSDGNGGYEHHEAFLVTKKLARQIKYPNTPNDKGAAIEVKEKKIIINYDNEDKNTAVTIQSTTETKEENLSLKTSDGNNLLNINGRRMIVYANGEPLVYVNGTGTDKDGNETEFKGLKMTLPDGNDLLEVNLRDEVFRLLATDGYDLLIADRANNKFLLCDETGDEVIRSNNNEFILAYRGDYLLEYSPNVALKLNGWHGARLQFNNIPGIGDYAVVLRGPGSNGANLQLDETSAVLIAPLPQGIYSTSHVGVNGDSAAVFGRTNVLMGIGQVARLVHTVENGELQSMAQGDWRLGAKGTLILNTYDDENEGNEYSGNIILRAGDGDGIVRFVLPSGGDRPYFDRYGTQHEMAYREETQVPLCFLKTAAQGTVNASVEQVLSFENWTKVPAWSGTCDASAGTITIQDTGILKIDGRVALTAGGGSQSSREVLVYKNSTLMSECMTYISSSGRSSDVKISTTFSVAAGDVIRFKIYTSNNTVAALAGGDIRLEVVRIS